MASLPRRGEGSRDPQHFGGIDLLRILAALSVMLFHYAFRGAAGGGFTSFHLPALIPVAQYGYIGVELFFIISGFVITMSAESRTASRFVRARFLRIYPTFVIAMSITALAGSTVGGPRFEVSFLDWLANLTLFPFAFGRSFVDGVYWTLALELVFYAWVALFVWFGWFATQRLGIITIWLCAALAINALSSSKALHSLFLSDFAGLFAAGMLYFELRRHGPSPSRLMLLGLAFAMSVSGVLERAGYYRDELHAELDPWILVIAMVAVNALFVASFFLPRLPRLAPALTFLAAVSYPLYLLHENLGFILFNLIGDRLPASVAAFLVSFMVIGLAALIAHWIEPTARRFAAACLDRWAPKQRLVPGFRFGSAQLHPRRR